MSYKHLLIFLFLIGSGSAAMIYQIVWIRLSSLSIGATSLSLSVVIGAFFFGLGLGSLLSRYFNHQKRAILTTYAILEFVIGISALLLLPTLLNLDHFIASVPLLTEVSALKYFLIGLLLLIPTMAMGATLPLISTLMIQNSHTMGKWYAQVYSLNTFGAVLGALLCGFVLVPSIGLDGAVYSAVLINVSIALFALMVANKTLFFPTEKIPPPVQETVKPMPSIWTAQKIKALMVLFVTGFVSIATEIGWSKFLIIFIGSTIYGFSLLIAILLFSIATGAWVIRKRIDHLLNPTLWLGYALLLLATLLVITYSGLSYVPILQTYLTHSDLSLSAQNALKYMAIFALIFPPAFLFGVIFPLALSLFTQNSTRVQTDSATAFGLNTIAGILGAILAGFWIIPQFGTATLLLSMAAIIALTASILMVSVSFKKQSLILISLSLIASITIFTLPPLSYKPLVIASYNAPGKTDLTEDQVTFIKEAKSGVIAILDHGNQYSRLLNNGLSEAIIDHFNPQNLDLTGSLLALLPYLLHSNEGEQKSAFVIGLGGGISAYALTKTPIQSIKVAELEPAVVEAMLSIYPRGVPALLDKRVQLEIQDARQLLLVEPTRYDMIISQPSHPWLSGASNLFTEEFFALTKDRLKEDGIYSQWINLFKMDATTLKAVIKAFTNVYPYAASFIVRRNEDMILLGSKKPINPNYQTVKARLNTPNIQAILKQHHITTPEELAPYQGLNRFQMVNMTQNTISSNQTNIITEVRLSKLGYQTPLEKENPFYLLEKWYNTPTY